MQQGLEVRLTAMQRVSEFVGDPKVVRVLLAVILGAVGAIPLVFVTPPFQVPDEPQHFYRAYQLSELRVLAEVQNGVAGETLPESLPQLVASSVHSLDDVQHAAIPAPIAKGSKPIPLEASKTRFVAFPSSAFYSPLPYLPQALGIALGRACGLGPLSLLYMARFFNCVVALALLAFAIYVMPVAEEIVIIVGLLPMSMFLYGSVSPDAAVIGCALVFTALSFSAGVRGNWKTWELVAAAAAAAVLCSVKPVYAPILLVGLFPYTYRRTEMGRVLRAHAIILAIALGITVGWMLFAKSAMTTLPYGGHPTVQARFVLHHPMAFLSATAMALRTRGLAYYFEAVGVFGWLLVPNRPGAWYIFPPLYCLPPLSFALVWILGFRQPPPKSTGRSLWYLALALASALLIMLALYLMYALVAEDRVTGVQGRYFIPLFALAGVAVVGMAPGKRPPGPHWAAFACLAGTLLLEIVAMDATIIHVFAVF